MVQAAAAGAAKAGRNPSRVEVLALKQAQTRLWEIGAVPHPEKNKGSNRIFWSKKHGMWILVRPSTTSRGAYELLYYANEEDCGCDG